MQKKNIQINESTYQVIRQMCDDDDFENCVSYLVAYNLTAQVHFPERHAVIQAKLYAEAMEVINQMPDD